MANEYYDNSDEANRFLGGETARGSDVDAKLDAIQAGFEMLPTPNQVNFGAANFGADTGAANAYVVTLTKTPSGYFTGMQVKFLAVNANTGPSTININELGYVAIVRQNGTALRAGDISASGATTVLYDAGTSRFLLDTSTGKMVSDAEAAASNAQTSASNAAQTKNDVVTLHTDVIEKHDNVVQLDSQVSNNATQVAQDLQAVQSLKSTTDQQTQIATTKANEASDSASQAAASASAVNNIAGLNNYDGAYSATKTYAKGQSVDDESSYWISRVDGNLGNPLVNGDYWSVIASKEELQLRLNLAQAQAVSLYF